MWHTTPKPFRSRVYSISLNFSARDTILLWEERNSELIKKSEFKPMLRVYTLCS